MFENYTRVYEFDRNMQRALFIKLLNQKSTILTKNHHDDDTTKQLLEVRAGYPLKQQFTTNFKRTNLLFNSEVLKKICLGKKWGAFEPPAPGFANPESAILDPRVSFSSHVPRRNTLVKASDFVVSIVILKLN